MHTLKEIIETTEWRYPQVYKVTYPKIEQMHFEKKALCIKIYSNSYADITFRILRIYPSTRIITDKKGFKFIILQTGNFHSKKFDHWYIQLEMFKKHFVWLNEE